MTKDEINEYLFQHLFDHQLTVLDYMTPDGMMQVIDAMRDWAILRIEEDEYLDDATGRQYFVAFVKNYGRRGRPIASTLLPEAVARAAVAFLKEAKNDE